VKSRETIRQAASAEAEYARGVEMMKCEQCGKAKAVWYYLKKAYCLDCLPSECPDMRMEFYRGRPSYTQRQVQGYGLNPKTGKMEVHYV
jgi:hypothetical protein